LLSFLRYSFMVKNSTVKPIIDITERLAPSFFTRDVLEVAPDLLGKLVVRQFSDGTTKTFIITETEAYRGEEDLACHASKGRTPRTETMYLEGGVIYIYLIYGMYWMLNIVTGATDQPQAVLIRCTEGYNGPGKLTKAIQLDKSFNGEPLYTSQRLWICSNNIKIDYTTTTRVGIDYSGEVWKNKPWRFILK
jgi:DNA-3-methyladenine glycosylase